MNSSGKGNMEISNSRAMGVIILIALLFVFQVVTFTVHKIKERVYRTAETQVEGESDVAMAGDIRGNAPGGKWPAGKNMEDKVPERFRFNPNTIGLDSLQLLGFSQKQAQSILNYRSKGGKFRRREDFSRLYVVDSAMYASLEEYISIPDSKVLEAASLKSADAPGLKSSGPGPIRAKEGSPALESAVSSSRQAAESGADRRTDTLYGSKVRRNRFICNLNTADSTELVKLYGIGGYYARKILDYRERLGGSFVNIRQLLEIEGFSQERFAGIERSIEVKGEDVKGFSILDADRKALERHPYIGAYAARGILIYLEYKGRGAFKDNLQLLEHLVQERIISENNALRLREYLLHL